MDERHSILVFNEWMIWMGRSESFGNATIQSDRERWMSRRRKDDHFDEAIGKERKGELLNQALGGWGSREMVI